MTIAETKSAMTAKASMKVPIMSVPPVTAATWSSAYAPAVSTATPFVGTESATAAARLASSGPPTTSSSLHPVTPVRAVTPSGVAKAGWTPAAKRGSSPVSTTPTTVASVVFSSVKETKGTVSPTSAPALSAVRWSSITSVAPHGARPETISWSAVAVAVVTWA